MSCFRGARSARPSKRAFDLLLSEKQTAETPGRRLDKAEVLEWFLKDADVDDVDWLFSSIKVQDPERAQEYGFPHRKVMLTRRMTMNQRPSDAEGDQTMSLQKIVLECSNKEEELLEQVGPSATDLTSVWSEQCVVQFSVETCYVNEEEDVMAIPVLRMGNLEEPASVQYTTKAFSALPGVHFEEATGTVFFEGDESAAEIPIRILNNNQWNNTVEFSVALLPETCQGCIVGQFLWQTRVKVIDDSAFPSDRYQLALEQGETSSELRLFFDYVKLCLTDDVVWSGSIKMVLLDLLHILFSGVSLLTNAYIVDRILKNEDLQDTPSLAHWYLVLGAALLTLPEALLHFLDYRKPTWKVAGTARRFLQNALFRKFLDYADSSRAQIEPGSTIMSITRDVDTVVSQGYLSTLALVNAVCNVISMLLFKLYGNRLFGTSISPAVLIGFFVLPVVFLPMAAVRQSVGAKYTAEQVHRQDVCADLVASSVEQFGLLRDFHQRAFFAEAFDRSIMAYNKAVIDVVQVETNNHYFAKWIGKLVTALYIVLRGVQVVEGTCRLGIYMVDIQIFMSMVISYGNLFAVLMNFSSIQPALDRITLLINMPTNLQGHRKRTQVSARHSRGALNLDELPIVVNYPKYCFEMGGTSSLARTDIKLDGKISFHQGQLVAIAGPPGQGKTTLLKLLAGVLVAPDQDRPSPSIFVPLHLRALHVTTSPIFFFGTLLENLTYGTSRQQTATAADSQVETERVKTICEKLGVHQRAIDMLDSSEKMKWSEVFSMSQLTLLGLARALIYDPELMCIHKPANALNDEEQTRVIHVLKEFVTERGLESQTSKIVRRPRTCIYSTTGQTGMAVADQIVYVSDGRMRLMDNATLSSGVGRMTASPTDFSRLERPTNFYRQTQASTWPIATTAETTRSPKVQLSTDEVDAI